MQNVMHSIFGILSPQLAEFLRRWYGHYGLVYERIQIHAKAILNYW